jgi:VWFA-related protein
MRWPVAVAVLLLYPTLAAAQVREIIDVTITNLDVFVADSRGRAVRGLPRTEFELLEAGKQREIANFSEVSAAMHAEGATVAPSRSVLIVFDNTTLTLSNRRRAAEAIKGWMTVQLRPVDRIAVMTVTPTLQMRQTWTFDSRAAAAAVETIAGEGASPAEQQQREAQSRVDEVVRRAATWKPPELPPRFDEMTQAVRVYSAALMRDCVSTVKSIRASLAYFPPPAQKKVLIVVGEGLPVNPGSDLFTYLNSIKMDIESGSGPQLLRQGASSASPLTEGNEFNLAPLLSEVSTAAAKHGVMVYAINPGQNEKSGGGVADARPSDVRAQFAASAGARAGYEQIVRSTGGSAFYGTPADTALAQISNDLDSYYSLGFRAVSESGVSLVVKSKSGYRVRVTRAPAPQSVDDRMREAVLANHIAQPASNDLRIALAADPPTVDGDRRKVHLKVLIPVDSLHVDREGEEIIAGFVVYVSSGDERGSATRVNRQEHQFRWPVNVAEALKGKTITFVVDVLVPAGLTQISVGVIDQHSQQTGFDRVSLGV